MVYNGVLCYVMLCYVMLCCFMLCCLVWCYILLCCVVLYCVVLSLTGSDGFPGVMLLTRSWLSVGVDGGELVVGDI